MTSAALPLMGILLAIHPLGSEFRVNPAITGSQSLPAVAAHADGSFVVVWTSEDVSEDVGGIFGERFNANGAPIGAQFHVNTYTTGMQWFPSVAADPGGGFVVAWQSDREDGSNNAVLARLYGPAGSPRTAPFRVNTITTSSQAHPAVAMDSAGQFVIAFSGRDGANGYSAFERRYLSNGTPLGDEFRVNGVISGGILAPAVAFDSSGAFVVAFGRKSSADSDYDVFVRPFATSGAPLGIDFVVNDVTVGFQGPPGIAVGPGGGFVVAWPEAGEIQRARLYGANGHALTSSLLLSVTTSSGDPPAVLALPDGGFVAAFSAYTFPTDFTEILLRRYSSAGALVGNELRVNTYTTGRQIHPAIAGHPGGFVVVWSSSDDGSSYGVFGQRFSTTPVPGDANGDGVVDVADVFYVINFLFAGGPAPVG